MPVTDDQVAALRAHLAGDFDEHRRLRARLDADGARSGYMALIEGAFFVAVDRRFTKDTKPADVIEFVSEIRARSEDLSKQIDPRAAERLIWAVLGEGSINDIEDTTRFSAEMGLLSMLVIDQQLDDPALDEFMKKARAVADHLLG